jgi:hypothetical protein
MKKSITPQTFPLPGTLSDFTLVIEKAEDLTIVLDDIKANLKGEE